MGFEALLGNDQLKENLRAARRKGRMSHFYLLSGPRGSGKHTLAQHIAAAMLCSEKDAPCGVCRQVMAEFCKEDFQIILVKPEGYELRTLSELLPDSFSL